MLAMIIEWASDSQKKTAQHSLIGLRLSLPFLSLWMRLDKLNTCSTGCTGNLIHAILDI